MFPLYLQYLLIDFRQTFVTGSSWDTNDLITFLGQNVKVQGHTIAAEAHSTRRRYRRVQLFLVLDPDVGSLKATLVVLVVIRSLKIPKAFLICSRVQRNFASTFVVTFPTDLPSQICKFLINE